MRVMGAVGTDMLQVGFLVALYNVNVSITYVRLKNATGRRNRHILSNSPLETSLRPRPRPPRRPPCPTLLPHLLRELMLGDAR